MFQTEFCGPDYKLVISWDAPNNQSSFDQIIDSNQDAFYRLKEISQDLSKLSTEFVERMRGIHNISNVEQLHENIPNVTFRIENLKNLESYSDEVFLLRKEVEKLKNEKENLESELKNLVTSHESELSNAKRKQELKIQELENRYEDEMSDLRVYFENSFTDSLKQLTDVAVDQYTRKDADLSSNSENEATDQHYKGNIHTKFAGRDINREDLNESKIKMKANIGKDLKNVMKALARKKDEEIQDLKKNMEMKYSRRIEALQTEINRLMYDKILENNVKEIHSKLKEDYEEELQNLQNISDDEFTLKIKNEKEILEKELKLKFENESTEWSTEYEKKIEDLLSEVLVKSAVKSVTDELKYKAKFASPCPPSDRSTSELEQKEQQWRQKHNLELNQLKSEYEGKLQDLAFNYKRTIENLNQEKDSLGRRIEELRDLNERRVKEIQLLQVSYAENLKSMQREQDIDTEKITLEVNKMKTIHDNEISKLRDDILMLKKQNQELLERAHSAENISYEKIVAALVEEITDLITKEQIGESVTWPSELSALEQIFAKKFFDRNFDPKIPIKNSSACDMESETQLTPKYSCDSELDQILDERDGLRKVNVAVQGVIKMFTKYLTKCEDELNNTLIGELVKTEAAKKDDTSCAVHSLSDCDSTVDEENVRKVHFAPNSFEIMSLLKEDDGLDVSHVHNISIIECELNACLERLKNEAAAVLHLTSGKKTDMDDMKSNQDSCTQTVIDGQQLEKDQVMIQMLKEHIMKAEEDMAELNGEVNRLTQKINTLESIEGYGEALNSVPSSEKIFNSIGGNFSQPQEIPTQESEEFCPKCDKTREEAKREIDDLTSQVHAASNKMKSMNQFLERQTAEREYEREEFDKKLKLLQEQLKDRERDLYSIHKSRFESEITSLELQIKDLSSKLEESVSSKDTFETRLKAADGRVWQLRERNQDLEVKLAQKSELADQLEQKLKEKEEELLHHQRDYQNLLHQLEDLPDGDSKQFEELNEQHVASAALIEQMKKELLEVEKLVIGRTRELENTYVVVTCNTVISSPSEDISVCDRVGEFLRVVSPNGSDQSSSPIHVPINMLCCLHEKLKKLFRAEEAALKKMRDQDMQLDRLTNSIARVELERDTLEENLKTTSAKLAETKIELNNWQHGHHSVHFGGRRKEAPSSAALESMLEKKDREIQLLEEKLVLALSTIGNFSRTNSTDADGKQNSKGSRVSFAENLESYADSDVSRHAVVAEMSAVPQYFSGASSEIPLLHSETSDSSLYPIKMKEKLDVEHIISSSNTEEADKDDSIKINFDAFSCTQNASDDQVACSFDNKVNKSDELLVSDLKAVLENEKKYHQETAAKLRDLNLKRMREKKSWKELEIDFAKEKTALEDQLKKVTWELNSYKDQCRKYEEQTRTLSNELKTKAENVEDLKWQLNELKNSFEAERTLERSDFKKKELESENYCKGVVKERVEAQLKCEEYSKNIKRVNETLENEKIKSKNLTEALEKAKKESISLRETIKNLEGTVELIKRELEIEKENINQLTDANNNLKAELEAAGRSEVELKESVSSQYQPSESQTGSLRNLTEKVQKEVELAVELDENMLKSLESNSRSSSFFQDLFKISATLTADLKRILFKILQEGFEKLTLEEKNILLESCDWRGTELLNRFEQQSEASKHLQLQLEVGQQSNRELTNETRQMRMEISRLEMVLSYYDERMSFLVTKLDEYRSKTIKTDIALTSERSAHKQLEIYFENHKKEVVEKQMQYNKRIEAYTEQLNIMVAENGMLKHEAESLKNKVEALTAELNSVKVITQYHSDSESELSRSLNPLKLRLAEVQGKYSKIKGEYEKKKTELHTLKTNLKIEMSNNQKLENLLRATLDEKRELEKQSLAMRTKYDDLEWQKQKLMDKLEAAEVAEMMRRKLRATREDEAEKEQRNMDREFEKLKQNLLKTKDEFISLQYSWKRVCEEVQNVFLRMLRAEKNQRWLRYQKDYFLSSITKYEERFNTAVPISDVTPMRNYFNMSGVILSPMQKFKSVAWSIITVYRIRFLMRRRATSNHSKMIEYFKTNLPDVMIYPWCNTFSESDSKKPSENVAGSSNTKVKSRDHNVATSLPDEDSLQVIYQQFFDLRKQYLSDTKSTTQT